MAEPILCVVSFVMLCWILLLKSDVTQLKDESDRLRGKLDALNRELTKGVKTSGGMGAPAFGPGRPPGREA